MTPKIQNNPIPYIPKSEQKPRRMKFKTLAKLSIVLALIASLWGNYALLKRFYVFNCSEGGYLMTKETCDKFASKQMDILEAERLETIAQNPDLFN